MTTPDRLAAAVAQGHEDSVQVCGNCDGRKCMACVFREVHDACEHTCPDCCQDAVQVGPQEDGPRLARIHVTAGGLHAFPLVERVPGGWQSGAHRYLDVDVIDVQPITPARVSSPAGEDAQERASTAEVAEVNRAIVTAITDATKGRELVQGGVHYIPKAPAIAAVLAALSARPVQAQGTDDGEVALLAQAWAAEARKEREAHVAALARAEAAEEALAFAERRYNGAMDRAEAAEGRERALREAADDFESVVDYAHEVYEETDTEPAECTDECPGCAGERLRALLDGDSEGRES